MLFKNFRSPVIYHEKDASLEILSQGNCKFSMTNIVDDVPFIDFSWFMFAYLHFLILVSNVAVQELDEKVRGNSKSLDVVRCTSLEQHWIIKDLCSFSTLQNLLLYYPGNQEVDQWFFCISSISV